LAKSDKQFCAENRALCGLCGNDCAVEHVKRREDGVTCCNACWRRKEMVRHAEKLK